MLVTSRWWWSLAATLASLAHLRPRTVWSPYQVAGSEMFEIDVAACHSYRLPGEPHPFSAKTPQHLCGGPPDACTQSARASNMHALHTTQHALSFRGTNPCFLPSVFRVGTCRTGIQTTLDAWTRSVHCSACTMRRTGSHEPAKTRKAVRHGRMIHACLSPAKSVLVL